MIELNKILEKIERTCIEKQIDIFHGSLNEEKKESIFLKNENYDIDFLIEILGSKEIDFVVIDKLESEADEEFEKTESELNSMIIEEVRDKLKELFKKYKENNGKVYSIRIVISVENKYNIDYILHNKYYHINKDIETLLSNYNSYFFNTEEYQMPEIQEFQLSKSEIKKRAKSLSVNERFQRAKNEKQRYYITEEELENESLDKKTLTEISYYANSLYEIDIKPVKENKLRKTIQGLRRQGKTKSEISYELDISNNIVEKYF